MVAQMASPACLINGTFGVFLVPVTQEFGWSRSQFSLGMMILAWTTALSFPLTGRLMDRHGVRALLVPGMFLFGATLGALAIMPGSLALFYFLFCIIGISAACTGPVPASKVIAGWFTKRRGTALALSGFGLAFATAFLPAISQGIAAHYGWRSAFVALAAYILIVGLPVVYFALHESPAIVTRRLDPHRLKASLIVAGDFAKAAVLSLELRLCLAASVLFVLVSSGMFAHLIALLGDRGFASSDAAEVVACAAAGIGVARLYEGFVLDYFGTPRVAIVLCLPSLVGILMLHYGSSFTLYLVGGLLFGLGVGGEITFIPYALSQYFGVGHFTRLYGMIWAASAIAAGIGPVIFGVIFDRMHSYAVALSFAELAVASTMACLAFLPPYRPRSDRL
ncbi:MFS transporter [Bradyrhizobium canariense]|uniref:MFS transporter n=1 Tax=Bradyrhizobium canariense TaxID=255045 RepID=UPI001CA48BAB|nr:MFS transporter [Bradyrhizobium canariense]